MNKTTHIRVYKADAEKIKRLANKKRRSTADIIKKIIK